MSSSTSTELFRPLTVVHRAVEAENVISLGLTDVCDRDLAPWTPGAHIDVRLPNGALRQYSLCGSPADVRTYRIAVRRSPASRGGSAYVHDRLSVGERVSVSRPRNRFELVGADAYLFIAGGIGVTPLLPMIGAAKAAGSDWSLHYAVRDRATAPFLTELAGDDAVHIAARRRGDRLDVGGLVGSAGPGTEIYCCGPPRMLADVTAAADRYGVDVHVERFEPDRDAGEEFEVECARSGKVVCVGGQETVLDALRRAGVPVDSSCEAGACGTCEQQVLDGVPDHRDSFLTPAERHTNASILVCVSRSKTDRLTLNC